MTKIQNIDWTILTMSEIESTIRKLNIMIKKGQDEMWNRQEILIIGE